VSPVGPFQRSCSASSTVREAMRQTRAPISPFVALVRLELTRCLPQIRNGLLLALGGTGLLLLSGTERTDLLAFPAGVVGLSFAMTVGMNGLRDRMDHGLEFVQALPVAAEIAAAARMAACGILCGLGTLLTTSALALMLQDMLGRVPTLGWFLATAAASWAGLLLVGALVCGALLRYSQARIRLVLPLFGIATVVLVSLPDGWLPSDRWFLSILSRPWFAPAVQVTAWALGLVAAGLAHRLLTVAIRDFRPARDKIEW
jgi:hypothetical protein